jgi:ubiquinone/menaquinone biosynthesis C-methylase UbiE
MFSTPSICLSQFNIEPGMVVADLGCGMGAYTLEAAARVGSTGKVCAVDVQKNLVESLTATCKTQHLLNVSVLWDDMDDANGIGLQTASIDRAIVANTLFQLDDIQKFATEVKRILKPKGQALIVDWAESFGGIGPAPQQVISESRAKDIFEKVGLYTVKPINAGEHHYGFVVQST